MSLSEDILFRADTRDKSAEDKTGENTITTATQVDRQRSLEEGEKDSTERFGQNNGLPSFPDGGTEAWTILFGVFALNFSTFGIAVSWGAFQAYYQRSLLKDYSPSTIAWIGSLQFALIFMPGSVTGRLLDMGHHKWPQGLASILLVLCAFLTAECKEYWQFLLCQGIGMGLAMGILFPPTLGLVSQWFYHKRGMAFGITATGSSLGGITFPIMVRFLIPSVGFKWTARTIAFVMAFFLTIGFLTTKTRLPPRPVERFLSLEAVRSAKLQSYTAASFFSFLGMYTILTFLATSAVSKGIDPSLAFYFISIVNGASTLGRVASGFMGDKLGSLNVMIPFTFIASLVTYLWPQAHSVAGFAVVSAIYGIAFGAFIGLLPSTAALLGPIQTVGERIGFQLTFMSIAILIGSPIAGAVQARPLGYTGAGIYAGSCILAGVLCLILTRRLGTGVWFGKKM